jgi:hypothetical protein
MLLKRGSYYSAVPHRLRRFPRLFCLYPGIPEKVPHSLRGCLVSQDLRKPAALERECFDTDRKSLAAVRHVPKTLSYPRRRFNSSEGDVVFSYWIESRSWSRALSAASARIRP